MNIILGIAVFALLAWGAWHAVRKTKKGGGCCGNREEAVARIAVRDKNKAHYPHQVTLVIGGMTCENCARRVENALNALPDTWAKVDLAKKEARVRTKEPPEAERLFAAVRDAGYVVMK